MTHGDCVSTVNTFLIYTGCQLARRKEDIILGLCHGESWLDRHSGSIDLSWQFTIASLGSTVVVGVLIRHGDFRCSGSWFDHYSESIDPL